MSIPVYLSRHNDLPEEYGAFIAWDIGEIADWHTNAHGIVRCIIKSGLKLHHDAPIIDSAMGRGRYVIEVEHEGSIKAVSARRLRMSGVSHV